MNAQKFYDGQKLKSITLPGEGEPGWLIDHNGCTGIEVTLEGGEYFWMVWFTVYVNREPKYKVSGLHVVAVEYLDS